MDKSKNKDNLRAAGKKRLEEFRQKKQQKSVATKNTGTALKVLAGEDKLPSSASSSPRTPNHDESPFTSTETDHSRHDSVPQTHGFAQAMVDSNRDTVYTDENHHTSAGRNVDHSTTAGENNDSSHRSDTEDVCRISEPVEEKIITDDAAKEEEAGFISGSTIPSASANSDLPRGQDPCKEGNLDGESSSRTLHQSIVSEATDVSEAQLLSRQAKTSSVEMENEREKGIVQLSSNAEQKSEKTLETRSLLAEIESLQLQLTISQQEKEPLSVDIQSAHAELENHTDHSAQELSTTLEIGNQSKLRESHLMADLEAAKREMVQVNGEVVPELERLQKQLTERETEAMELKEELVTSKDLLVQLQEERSSLMHEVGQFRAELQALGQEKLQLASELETSQRCMRSMEIEKDQLLSERISSMQQVRDLMQKNEQVTDELKESFGKFRDLALAKEHEREVSRVQIESIAAENIRLTEEFDAERACLNKLRVEKPQYLVDMNIEHEQLREAVEKLQTCKLAKEHELEALKVQLASFAAENVRLAEELDVERERVNGLSVERGQLLADMNDERAALRESVENLQTSLQEVRMEKSQLLADLDVRSLELRELQERLELSRISKDRELEACRVQIASITAENVRLAEELDAERACAGEMRMGKAQLLTSLCVERKKLERLLKVEVEVLREVEALKTFLQQLRYENSSLLSGFKAEFSVISVELHKIETAYSDQDNQLSETREELQRTSEEHVRSMNNLEIALDECSRMLDNTTVENIKLTEELNIMQSKLLVLTEERELAVASLGTELQESKELVRQAEEQNSALVKLLEEAKSEMQRVIEENARSVSELESELDKQKLQFSKETEDRGRLFAELQEAPQPLDSTMSLRNHQADINRNHEELKQLEENRTLLSSELVGSKDELTELQEEKSHAAMEIRALKEQVEELENKYLISVQKLEDTEAELRNVRDHGLQQCRDLEVELEKERRMRTDLSEEKDMLAIKLQGVQEQLEVLRQKLETSTKNYASEMLKYEEQLTEIGESRTKLSSELVMTRDKLTELQEERYRAEVELPACKERLARLEEDVALSLERYRDETAVHEGSMRELEESCRILKSELLSCQDELMKLRIEKDEVHQELVAQMEKLKTMEALNYNIAGELAGAKQRADVHVEERAVLLTEHRSEVASLREELSRLEGLNAVSTSDIVQLLSDLEALKKEKDVAYSQVEILREDSRRLGEEKSRLTDALMESRDQVQLLVKNEELRHAELRAELEYHKEHAARRDEEKATLLEEFEVAREHLRGVSDQKMSEIDMLLKQVEELSQSKEHAVNELTAAFGRADKVEKTRIELASKLEAVERQLQDLSRDKDSLITNLDASRQQYEELEKEKAVLLSGFEDSVNNWKVERSDLQQDLELSKEMQSVFAAEKDGMAADLAIAKQRMEEMAEVQAQAAAELGALKQSIQSSEEEITKLVAQLNARDQQVQVLLEEKSHLTSELQIHSARILVMTEEVTTLTEELNLYKNRLEVSEGAEDQSELRRQEGEHSADDVPEFREVPKEAKLELTFQSGEERAEGHFFEPRGTLHSVEDLEGLRRQIETKEGELVQLKTQYTLLQTKLESSDGERHVLAQELVTLRQQLQQLSESKSHVANELALGVEASRQRMLEYEEAKSESTSQKKSKQDLQAFGGEDPSIWKDSLVIQVDSGELPGVSLKKRSPMSRSDDSIVGLGSGVSKLIGEFERKAHAGQEQAEQLRRAVHENMRLTASVQRLESERHMLVEAPAQIADLQTQLEQLGKQISALAVEKDAAVGALLASQAELRQSREMVKEGNSMLADRLEVLEESVISLHTERDVLVGTLMEVEKSLRHASDETIKSEGRGLESAPTSDGMKDIGPLSSLIEKLEHAVLEAFPDASPELASLRSSKPAVEYCDILCDKLLNGDTGVCHQVQKAHLQLTDMRQRLTQSEEKMILVQQERDSVVQATQEYADQLAHQIADKAVVQAEGSALQARIAELESSLTLETNSRSVVDSDLRSIISKHWGEGSDVEHEIQSLQQKYEARELELSTVKKRLEEAAGTIAQQADEIKDLLIQTERLSEELEKVNIERESFQSSVTQAEQKLSLTREKLSMAVNKGKAVVQQRDALKQTLAEKSMLLEELKVTHEQEQHMKDVALQSLETKLCELEAVKEEYVQLETRCSFLQEIVVRAEKALQDSDQLVEGLSVLLESSMSVKDWHACELVEKIVWITSGTSKVIQIMEALKGESSSLSSTSNSLANHAEESQARAELLAHELSLLKVEKEELVSHFEEIRSNLQLELEQKIDEKSHLTSMIKQLDSDIETLRSASESMNKKLEEQATSLVGFEGEVSTLRKKLAEREEQWNHEVLRHQKLQANVYNIARNLVDIHQSLPPFEGDISSAQSSLAWCKQFMHVLVGRYNLIVEKLDEIARQSVESGPASEQASSESLSNKSVDQLSLRSVSTDLIKEVEEIFALVEKQAGEATTLMRRIEKQADELAVTESERLRLQQELSKSEQRSLTIREKLSSAVTKGKSLVQQRDALKQALAGKNDELALIISSHKKELQNRDAVLHETSEKLDAAMDQVHSLKEQFALLKTSVREDVDTSSTDKVRERETLLAGLQGKDTLLHEEVEKLGVAMDRVNSLEKELAVVKMSVQKYEELERILAETQLKVSSAEAEAQSGRNAADVAASELEQCRRTVEILSAQVKSVTEERDVLVEQLASSKSDHKDEVEEFLDEREKLVTTIGELENIISRQKDDMESLMRNFEELSESYNSLNAQSIEDATETTNLQDEINSLHNHIAELELAMEMEAAARQKLEADSDAVVASIQEVIQNSLGNHSIRLTRNDSPSSDTISLLEEMCSALIGKYKAVVQEVEELTEQVSVLSNLEVTSKAKTFFEQDSLSRMQQILQSKDVELNELSKRMEEAAIDMAQQQDVVQGLTQQVNKLRGEVAKVTGERDALQAELQLAEQRTASGREKLSLAVKKGKNVVQQRDALKQSLAEQELLLANCKEELELKESTLARISDELMISGKRVEGLESEVASLRKLTSTLEQDLQDRNNLIEALEVGLVSYSTAIEWRSKKLPQKVNWLVSAISDAESRAVTSYGEVEALRRESTELRTQLRDAQYQAEILKTESTQLSTQLRDTQHQAEALKKESTQLGTQLRDAQNQAEALRRESNQLGTRLRDTQYKAECEKETMSILTKKLEKTENELQWSQQRTAELEAQLPALALAHQKADTLSDSVRKLEARLEEKDDKIRNLESLLKQKNDSVQSLESMLEQKQADVRRAEEAVYAWAGRSEETEAYIHGSQIRISELESQLRTLSGVQQQAEQLSNQVKSLEEVVQQKQSALKALEASRTKAVNKLTTTVNKFRELCQQSEGLVAELERVQGSVESKDVEISQLKEDVGRSRALAQVLQARLDSRSFLLVQLEEKLRTSPSSSDVELSPALNPIASPSEQEDAVEGEDVFLTSVRLIQRRLEAVFAQSQSWQSELAKKDSQLQGLRKELDEANGERMSLRTCLHREQTQFERFKEEHASKYSAERDCLKVEEVEEVPVGKRSMPSTSAAPHVRGTKKPPSFDVAIDMGFESSRLLEVSDEKGHGFKALASARFMPRGTRFIGDRIDRICVAGGRVLMRQPGARLGLTLYWLAIHIWMALLIATAHV